MTMGHRVAVLKDGLLQQCDTPRKLYDHPDNAFVAGFIGSPAMNLKTVPLANGGAQLGSHTVPLPKAILDAAGSKNLKEVTIGLRPEQFSLTSDQQDSVALKVDLVEELGADAYLYGTTDLSDEEKFVVRVDGKTPPSMGSTVRLKVSNETWNVFDPESGDRLGD
jgi:multiple sugar transport system ATP-binding protein